MEEQVEKPEGFEGFDERVKEDVEGLLWLGHLEKEVRLGGHTFVLRTLKGDEELVAGLLGKEYMETMTQAKAWAWAQVSLSIVSVDGDDEFCPKLGPGLETSARARFRYCTSQWYWSTAKILFDEYIELQARQEAAVTAMRPLSTEDQTFSMPLPKYSTEPESSKSEILDLVQD